MSISNKYFCTLKKKIIAPNVFFYGHESSGGYTITSQERAYARLQVVSFLGKEVFVHNVDTKDGLRIFCACVVFFSKIDRILSWECCAHMFGHGLPFYCVEIVHVNVEFSCNCMKHT